MKKKHEIVSFFNFALAIKALDGILELIAGIALIFITNEAILNFVQKIVEYTADTMSYELTYKIVHQLFYSLTDQRKHLITAVLIANGVVKIILSISLILRKRWSFPVSIYLLSSLIIYQLIESLLKHSIVIHIMNFFDVIVLILIIREFLKFKKTSHS